MRAEVDFPKPNTLTASEAAKWYRSLVPLIPKIKIDEAYGDNDEELRLNAFKAHWAMKCRLRLGAALALYDQELVDDFFQAFPLPSANWYLGAAYALSRSSGEDVTDVALYLLLDVSEAEKRKFPGTVGEAIGLEIRMPDGIHVMTEKGWARKE